MTIGLVAASRNAALTAAFTTAIGTSGKLRIYSGTRPATGGTETTILAELALSSAFAPAPSAGVLTANAISNDASADASGTPTWARLLTSANVAVADMSAGVGSGDLNMSAAIVATGVVAVSSMVITDGNP